MIVSFLISARKLTKYLALSEVHVNMYTEPHVPIDEFPYHATFGENGEILTPNERRQTSLGSRYYPFEVMCLF